MVEFKLLLTILAAAGLFFIVIAFFLGTKIGRLSASKYLTKEIKIAREDAVKRSRAVLNGQFAEQFAAFSPIFPLIRRKSVLSVNRLILSHFPAFLPARLMRFSLSK